MTCSEGCTSCNGFSLIVLVVLAVVLNTIPLISYKLQSDELSKNPISCFEWWFPGIIGAGVLVIPAIVMSLAARKRAFCNNRLGMILSSFLSVLTIGGAVYCILVSLLALSEGPLICNYNGNSTFNCEFSMKNLSDIHDQLQQPITLRWFFSPTCQPEIPNNSVPDNSINIFQRTNTLTFSSEENKHKIIHLTVFVGLLLVGILEILFSISQIVTGLFGCLCGVSKRSRKTW
ncbi:transmembrane 4 L6 family member 20 [Antechinus flavipes]|uniref:transmembrane 4 L6 family member 20 n=1 Tax=Antechinus flavipes TaxID=38775 RepID=UPI002235E2C8|nr:transmembrane 4 L6 family member 20 [Antechinus flavipes]